MGKSLAEYAAAHPLPVPDPDRQAMKATARNYRERQQDRETVEQLKESIMQQLEQGSAPQFILYPALKAIGILTNDQAWTDKGQKILDSVYADLAQQSLLTDNAAVAAQRLDQMQADFITRAKKRTQQNINACVKLQKELNAAMNTLTELEQQNGEQ